MLDYEWTNPSHLLIPTEVDHPIPTPTPTHHHPFPDPFDFPFDPRALPSASFPPPPSNFPGSPPNFFFIPKPEPDFSGISLNLGGRTYFSAATDEDFVNRLYHRRSRATEGGVGHVPAVVRCQAEGCNADLSNAKHYHRRHKVCEFHSKAASVVAGGLTQRFCQQCSRFHLLAEFDNGKRSCRRRLADHNRRRRKSHQSAANPDRCNALTENSHHSSHSDSFQSSPSDSGANLSSTVTIAVSPQAEYGKKAAYNTTASFTVSSSPIFYSSGH